MKILDTLQYQKSEITIKEKICCFTGHRKIPPQEQEAITRKLENIIDRLYQRGVQYYGAGGALGFDYEKGNIM